VFELNDQLGEDRYDHTYGDHVEQDCDEDEREGRPALITIV